jgi:hypothetical protein
LEQASSGLRIVVDETDNGFGTQPGQRNVPPNRIVQFAVQLLSVRLGVLPERAFGLEPEVDLGEPFTFLLRGFDPAAVGEHRATETCGNPKRGGNHQSPEVHPPER